MTTQSELWQQVGTIKRRILAKYGEKPPHEIRSRPAYRAYTAMCGEAY